MGPQKLRPSLLEPVRLEEFAGQYDVVEIVTYELAAALPRGRMLRHMLMYGPPGIGKTTLGKILSRERDVPVWMTSGFKFNTAEKVLEDALILERYRGGVLWIIDEVDGMTKGASQVFHNIMSENAIERDGRLVSLPPLTVYATTNYIGSVPAAMKSRFEIDLRLKFEYYDPQSLEQIVKQTARRLKLSVRPDAAVLLASNAGGEPRKVQQLLRSAANLTERVDAATVRRVMRMARLYPLGLTSVQVGILVFLANQKNGKAGVETIARRLGESKKDVEYEHEIFLLQDGYTTVESGPGRVILPKGREYLAFLIQNGYLTLNGGSPSV